MPTTAPAGFAEAQAAVADVEGWMTPGQARALWDAASYAWNVEKSARETIASCRSPFCPDSYAIRRVEKLLAIAFAGQVAEIHAPAPSVCRSRCRGLDGDPTRR